MDEIEEIKRRIDIVEFVSSYLTLKKAGANYRAVCPFHQEKTPSFMISAEKQIFKCFGCGAGGDIFEFIMKMENLEFREALEMLAQRAGVKLTKKVVSPQEKETQSRKTRLFQINALAAQVFHKILMEHPSGKIALDYLKNRGLKEEIIREFMIGFAPNTTILGQFLKQKGFLDKEIADAGNPTKFYKRVIFPIRDVMNNVVGFTGRVIEKGQEPKYYNTPETIIFHKGQTLYNLDKARNEIKLKNTAILVEGQMDVIMSYQAGVKNVIASSGTALTADHLAIINRYASNIIFAFDNDSAGLMTAKKAYEMAIEQGLNVKMTNLKEFKDPGEIAQKDPDLWQKVISESKPVIDWYFDLAFKDKAEELNSIEKKEIAKELLPVIMKLPDNIEQAHYIGKLAKKLQVNEKVIYESIERIRANPKKEKSKTETAPTNTVLNSEETFLGLLFNDPALLKKVSLKIKVEDLIGKDSQTLYSKFLNWYNENNQEDPKSFLSQLDKVELNKAKLLSLEVAEKYPASEQEKAFFDVTEKIRFEKNESIKKYFANEISRAEQTGNREKLQELMKEFQNAISK